MKVMSIFGTRPEIIRLSRIFPLLDKHFEHIMVNTSQNFTDELNSLFIKELGIRKPDYDLEIRTKNFGDEISDIIKKIDVLLLKEQPDMVLILGDTNSGLSAIPTAHHRIKIVHLEAGMRSYDYRMPEEKNRIMIDHLSSILFPYTQYSKENLLRENISPRKIFVIGNPIVEVLNYYSKKIDASKILQKFKLKPNEYFLVTAHRSENVDDLSQLKQIFSGLEKLHKKFHKRIIFPIHPRTISKIKNFKIPKSIETFKPLGFFDFTKLEKNAFCLITDSGTVPEESLYFKKPCVCIRESTERPEYLETGSTIISGLEPKDIVESVSLITSHTSDWEWDKSLGDGKTSSKVVNIMRGKSRKLIEF
ncbi:MAG: UDP-N-acetylglucosamine 2-epimerase (non-hydrolyzing) [Thaumarchaeota archaeon]|jgi:UDP-N-acetylglucosamine 2-epimerase (non-hydrolysing)|nr:MAG: UDP-N-acetylglucosamine 2-epimerase (non-hydrolyzing) [Nitrososphaerota archaeon]